MSSTTLRYGIQYPLVRGYSSKHRTLEAAEKALRMWARKHPNSKLIPNIVDLRTMNYVK